MEVQAIKWEEIKMAIALQNSDFKYEFCPADSELVAFHDVLYQRVLNAVEVEAVLKSAKALVPAMPDHKWYVDMLDGELRLLLGQPR